MKKDSLGRVLRTIALILIGTTAAGNVLGGVGKVCAAFMTRDFPPLWALLSFQWFYQLIMVLTLLIGVAGIWSVIQLVRGGDQALRNAFLILIVGVVILSINVAVSLSLRGKAAPTDMRLYLTLFTLLFVAITRLPGLRDRVKFSKDAPPFDRSTASGLVSIVTGLVVLSTPVWAGPSHTFMGQNWVNVLLAPIILVGGGLLLAGAVTLSRTALAIYREEFLEKAAVGGN
jgi:hypothetical protein